MASMLKPLPLFPSLSTPSANLHHFPPPKPSLTPPLFSHPAALLLELCSDAKELHQMLPLIIKSGLSSHHPVQTKLVSLFSKFGHLHYATLVFDRVDCKIDETYHTILKGVTALIQEAGTRRWVLVIERRTQHALNGADPGRWVERRRRRGRRGLETSCTAHGRRKGKWEEGDGREKGNGRRETAGRKGMGGGRPETAGRKGKWEPGRDEGEG